MGYALGAILAIVVTAGLQFFAGWTYDRAFNTTMLFVILYCVTCGFDLKAKK